MSLTQGPGLSQGQAINIRIAAHQSPIHDQAAGSVTTDASYSVIYTYTSTDNRTRVLHVEASAGTFGHYRIKIDGIIVRELHTTGSIPNANFIFFEPRTLTDTQVLTVEFKPYRLRAASQATFTALEGYVGL